MELENEVSRVREKLNTDGIGLMSCVVYPTVLTTYPLHKEEGFKKVLDSSNIALIPFNLRATGYAWSSGISSVFVLHGSTSTELLSNKVRTLYIAKGEKVNLKTDSYYPEIRLFYQCLPILEP